MPAKAGIHEHRPCPFLLDGYSWTPAFAGVTRGGAAALRLSLRNPPPHCCEGEERTPQSFGFVRSSTVQLFFMPMRWNPVRVATFTLSIDAVNVLKAMPLSV